MNGKYDVSDQEPLYVSIYLIIFHIIVERTWRWFGREHIPQINK